MKQGNRKQKQLSKLNVNYIKSTGLNKANIKFIFLNFPKTYLRFRNTESLKLGTVEVQHVGG